MGSTLAPVSVRVLRRMIPRATARHPTPRIQCGRVLQCLCPLKDVPQLVVRAIPGTLGRCSHGGRAGQSSRSARTVDACSLAPLRPLRMQATRARIASLDAKAPPGVLTGDRPSRWPGSATTAVTHVPRICLPRAGRCRWSAICWATPRSRRRRCTRTWSLTTRSRRIPSRSPMVTAGPPADGAHMRPPGRVTSRS